MQFHDWQERALNSPEAVYQQFHDLLNNYSTEQQNSLFSSTTGRVACLSKLLEHCPDEDKPLRGISYALQDLIDAPGHATTCGAPFVEAFDGELDLPSTLYQRLDDLGATLIAKCVPAEFGIDPRGRNQTYGDLQHPKNLTYISGGGAGSCVRAVQEKFVPLAFGIDSCGGMRIPCAFQGTYGFRMGQNAFIEHGVFPVMPSLESIAWATNSLDGLKATYSALYPSSVNASSRPVKGVVIDDAGCRVSPQVKNSLRTLTQALDIDEDPSLQTDLIRAFKDGGSALQLLQSRELYAIHQYWIDEYRDRYDTSLLRRIYRGMECSTAEVERSGQIQERIRNTMARLFQSYDFLIMPVSTVPTPTINDWTVDLEADLMQLNAPASLSVLSAIIIPTCCGAPQSCAAQIIVPPHRPEVVHRILEQLEPALRKDAIAQVQ